MGFASPYPSSFARPILQVVAPGPFSSVPAGAPESGSRRGDERGGFFFVGCAAMFPPVRQDGARCTRRFGRGVRSGELALPRAAILEDRQHPVCPLFSVRKIPTWRGGETGGWVERGTQAHRSQALPGQRRRGNDPEGGERARASPRLQGRWQGSSLEALRWRALPGRCRQCSGGEGRGDGLRQMGFASLYPSYVLYGSGGGKRLSPSLDNSA